MDTTTTNEQLYLEGRYDELFERNQDFIWHVHKRYFNIYIEREDYESLCGLAFARAIRVYNPETTKFISFWGTVIHSEMMRYLKNYKKKEKYGIEIYYLDAPTVDGEEITHQDILVDYNTDIDEFMDSFDNAIIRDCIKKLTPKQIKVYELYLQGHTHKAIADKLNVTRQAVSTAIKNGKAVLTEELRKSGIGC